MPRNHACSKYMSMIYTTYILIVFVQGYCNSYEEETKTLHCRDNWNEPVDWWYVYKPPASTGPYFEGGMNFSYVTSSAVGRWRASHTLINSNSMLELTLAPVYKALRQLRRKKTNKERKKANNDLAIVSYGETVSEEILDEVIHSEKSTAYGIMFANSKGGVWISHTVSGFPDLDGDRAAIPIAEYPFGHMLMCLTFDLDTLNELANVVRYARPYILKIIIPDSLETVLKNWLLMVQQPELEEEIETDAYIWEFMTRDKTLRGIMVSRTPEDETCLFKRFAMLRGITLDIYSSAYFKEPRTCKEFYSLRYIESVSFKFSDDQTEQAYYINKDSDKMSFAVNTGALWQRFGELKLDHWTCIGNMDRQRSVYAKGGMISCVNHYYIWLTFDSFKLIKPAACPLILGIDYLKFER